MTAWHGIYAVAVLLAAFGVLSPLILGRRATAIRRAERELEIHRSRYAQVALDRERGLISEEEAAGAEAEIGRAIIAATRRVEENESGASASGGLWPVAAMTFVAFAAAIGTYGLVGSWGSEDMPLAARDFPRPAQPPTLASEHEGSAMAQAIESLRQRLEANPGSPENWRLLARSYTAVGDDAAAAATYEQLLKLTPQDLDSRGNYGEALVRKDAGFVGPTAVKQFEIVLAHAPKDPRARYYLGLYEAQSGNDQEAAEQWVAILRDAPPDAPYRPAIRKILEAVIRDGGLDRASLNVPEPSVPVAPEPTAPGPTAEDVAAAAAMPEEDQLAMIRTMVERLEARLEETPEDPDGWLRLARSRLVLGERDAAIAALEKGVAANPDAAALATALAELKGSAAD